MPRKDTSHSSKFQDWSLTIRLFYVESRTYVAEGGTYSVYFTAPADWVTRTLDGDAVDVFYYPCWLGHPDTRWRVVLLLCRDAVGVFYSSSWLGHQNTRCGDLLFCRDAVDVFYYPCWLGHPDTRWGVVLLLCRDAVGVFYSSSWLGHQNTRCGDLLFCRDAVDVF